MAVNLSATELLQCPCSPEEHPNPIYTQQKMDGVFIMTHNSTLDKKKLLEEIARELNLGIDVSIVL